MKQLIAILLIILLPAVAGATDRYIDCQDGGSNAGTYANPWTDIDSIAWNASDDYYFLEGTNCAGDETSGAEIIISIDGTNSNHVNVGSYTSGPVLGTPGTWVTQPKLDNNDTSDMMIRVMGDYIDIWNLEIEDGTDPVRWAETSGAKNGGSAKYLYIHASDGNEISSRGLSVGIESGTWQATWADVEFSYNAINLGCDDSGCTGNAIDAGLYATGTIIKYNQINNQGHAGIFSNGDDTLIEGNNIKDDSDWGDTCIDLNPSADDNIVRMNRCKGADYIQVLGAARAIVDKNIIDCGSGCGSTDGNAAIHLHGHALGPAILAAKINGNVIYNWDTDMHCLKVNTDGTSAYGADDSEITNNICHTGSGGSTRMPIKFVDLGTITDDSSLVWENNNVYNWTGDYYARMISTDYATVAAFNGYSYAQNNVDEDPQLSNVASGEFWPASESSNSMDSGYNSGYDDYLLLETTWPYPPSITTSEDATDNKGVYTLFAVGTIHGVKIK